jgi:hypothetical protein
MKNILLFACALALATPACAAGDDVMQSFFGNTLVVSGGMVDSYTHFKPDHTFDATASVLGARIVRKGTWNIDDKGQLCRTLEDPPAGAPNPLCFAIAAHKPGDSWTITVNGNTRTLTLKAGIQ